MGERGLSGVDRAPFELFLIQEAALLDARRFRDWMALFAEDGTYWVPAVPNQDSPFNQASLFYDDRELMKTRVDRLEHPRIHVQTPPSRTAHLDRQHGRRAGRRGEGRISRRLDRDHGRVPGRRHQRVFAGRQHHRLRREGASFRIVQKRVDLINCDSAFEAMAVPI